MTDVDDLYALPLAEFTKARNALAKESGDKSIAKLPKPSAAAWALNQAARANKGDVARFLHAAAEVRDGADRDAIADLRTAEGDVRRAALRALGGRGGAQLGAVNTLLAAAAADEEVGETLRAGRLTGDEEPDAAGLLFAAAAPERSRRETTKANADTKAAGKASKDKAAKSGATTDKPARKDELKEARERRAREEARRKEEERKAALKEAQDEADRLAREAAEAEERAARLRERADRAQAKADALRKER